MQIVTTLQVWISLSFATRWSTLLQVKIRIQLCYTKLHCTASEACTQLCYTKMYCMASEDANSTLLHASGPEDRQPLTLWKQKAEYLTMNQWTLQVRTPSALTHTRTVSRCKWAIHQLCKHTSEQTLQVIRTTALQAHVQASAASKHKQQLCYTLRVQG